jgi:hypothetical protein
MLCIRNRLVPRPDPLVIGHGLPTTEHPHPVHVGDHLDPAAAHRRVHRIIGIGVVKGSRPRGKDAVTPEGGEPWFDKSAIGGEQSPEETRKNLDI